MKKVGIDQLKASWSALSLTEKKKLQKAKRVRRARKAKGGE